MNELCRCYILSLDAMLKGAKCNLFSCLKMIFMFVLVYASWSFFSSSTLFPTLWQLDKLNQHTSIHNRPNINFQTHQLRDLNFDENATSCENIASYTSVWIWSLFSNCICKRDLLIFYRHTPSILTLLLYLC